jgi:hypothetical protein
MSQVKKSLFFEKYKNFDRVTLAAISFLLLFTAFNKARRYNKLKWIPSILRNFCIIGWQKKLPVWQHRNL